MDFTFYSSAHGTFSRIDHILCHQTSLGKFKKTYVISIIFSDHNEVRLDVKVRVKSLSRLTLCDCMDYCLSSSSVHGIFQARILKWVAISFSRRSSQPRDWIQVSGIVGRCFNVWAIRVSLNVNYRGKKKPKKQLLKIQTYGR